MKKQIILTIASLIALSSCNGGESSYKNDNKNTESDNKRNLIRRPLSITNDYNQITSIGGVDIVYSQGDYSIEIEGDSALCNHISLDIESGILTISLKGESNKDINPYDKKANITAYISSPDLKCVALCSSGDFTAKGKWELDNIELGVIGDGNYYLDSICCKEFKYIATGNGNAECKYLEASEKIEIGCMGESDITANINTNYLNVATNKGKVKLSGIARIKDIAATNAKFVEDKTTR